MLIILNFLVSIAMAQNPSSGPAVGFSRGSDFTAVPIQGQVQVTCSGFNGEEHAVFNCRDVILEPQPYDYFLGPDDRKSDAVELTATHQDGTERVKSFKYDGQNGRTIDPVNLWISTLFQKPLLMMGRNEISYKLFRKGKETGSGEFTVNVNRGPGRTCQPGTYTSSDVNDCSSQYSVCQRYLKEQNFCQ